jgi:predicted TIM-barrel fold metal-dependent hydrolase
MTAHTVRLLDHHCHGVVTTALDRAGLEALMSESFRPPAPGTNHFQKPLGLMVRRHCAPLLDLEPLASAEAYVERRLALGPEEVNRRLLRACGLSGLLIDTGHRADAIADVPAMADIAGQQAREVVRIEAVAEAVAASGGSAAAYPAAFAEALAARAADAVGLKSIVAYRCTFAIEQTAPSRAETVAAAGAWFATMGDRPRLTDPVLIRHGLFAAAEMCRARGMPLQLHVGIGDPDIVMHKCDPTQFTEFFRATEAMGVAITLLHNYPFIREAGWLAEVFQNIYFDVGVVLSYTGPSAAGILRQALELAPWTKHLYSSDAFGLAELHYIGAIQFRRALSACLDAWIGDGDCTVADADAITHAIARGNAERIYPL